MQCKVVYTGIILPAGWDSQGEVIDFSIATYDDHEYPVQGIYSELLEAMRKPVIVSGFIKEDEVGKEVIVIENLKIMRE